MRHCTNHLAYDDDCSSCRRAERSNLGFGRSYGYGDTDSNAGQLGVDLGSGDLTVGIGNGMAIDTRTGDLEIEIAPGLDIDVTDLFD